MRLFLALSLDDDVRARVADLQTRLADACAEEAPDITIKWTTPDTFHLTVLFLGEQTAPALPLIEGNCAILARETAAPFRFGLAGASYFPKRGPQVKTILCGVGDGASEWEDLARRAETGVGETLGLPKGSGALVPHVTLGRVKGEPNRRSDARLQGQRAGKKAEDLDSHAALRAVLARERDADCGAQLAKELALMQSVLSPQGATHNTLNVWKLGDF